MSLIGLSVRIMLYFFLYVGLALFAGCSANGPISSHQGKIKKVLIADVQDDLTNYEIPKYAAFFKDQLGSCEACLVQHLLYKNQGVNNLQDFRAKHEGNLGECDSLVLVDYKVLERACSDTNSFQPDPRCLEILNKSLHAYARDRSLPIVGGCGDIRLKSNPHPNDRIRRTIFNNFLGGYCGLNTKHGKLHFDGGDMLIDERFILIGRNNLEFLTEDSNVVKYPKYFKSLGLSVENNTQETVEEITVRDLSLGARKIIWVGSDCRGRTYDRDRPYHLGYQPFYHIDMFLALSGYETNSKTITYVIAIPDSNFIDFDFYGNFNIKKDSILGALSDLTRQVRCAQRKMEKQIHQLGLNTRSIEIPFPFVFFQNPDVYILEYFALVNGLAENYNSDSGMVSNFYMPSFNNNLSGVKAVDAFRTAKQRLADAKINVVQVPGEVSGDAALHCKVLVTERE